MMAALQAVSKIVESLQAMPPGTLTIGAIGLRRPGAGGELPMIAVALTRAREAAVGLGGFVSLGRVGPDEWATTTGSGVAAELRIELWAGTAGDMATLISAVLAHLDEQAAALRSAGFLRLALSDLGPAHPATAGTDAALLMPLAFEIRYEHLTNPPPSGEGIIRNVHVDLTGEVDETMDIH
jgi:hypothetical protein